MNKAVPFFRPLALIATVFRSDQTAKAGDLLSVEQVPDVLKEPYIFTGYRPLGKPWKYYVCSVLILHNESMNVWTHIIGFLLVLLRLLHFFRSLNILHDKAAWPILGFSFGCLFSLALSASAHLLHSKSRWCHFLFFLLDYMGVTFYLFGSGVVSMFTLSSKGYHDTLDGWFLPANVLLSWFTFFTCCLAKTHLSHNNTKRKSLMLASITLQGIFISMPVLSRYIECLLYPACKFDSLGHITVVLVLLCMCGATFAGHCPESLLPGSFDILGHGHQIFHVLSVILMLLEVRVIDIEVNEMGSATFLQPDLTHICLAFVALFLLEVSTLLYYVNIVVFRRLSDEIPRKDVMDSLATKDGSHYDDVRIRAEADGDKKSE